MPDILGNWDRRSEDKDYNPQSNQIEPGYDKKQHKFHLEEEKEERERLRQLKKAIAGLNLTYNKLSRNNYALIPTWGGRGLSGTILSQNNNSVARIETKRKRNYLILTYFDQYDKFEITNVKDTVSFKEFLDKNKINYVEKQSKKEILAKLQEHQIKMKDIEGETSKLINLLN